MNTQFKLENVRSVYSGVVGKCMCGCCGKHSYAEAHRAEASKDRGWQVSDEQVSDRSVRTIANKVRSLIEQGTAPLVADDGSWLGVDTATRSYVLYFTNSHPLAQEPINFSI